MPRPNSLPESGRKRRGKKPCPEVAARNAEIARLFAEGAEVCDLAIQFGFKPSHIANIVRAAGISTKRHKTGPKPAAVAEDAPLTRPLGRSFCRQCDALRWPEEVRVCASRWCSLKGQAFAGHPIRRDSPPSFSVRA